MGGNFGIPVIFLNFKTYAEVLGRNCIKYAKIAEKISKEYGITIIIAPPTIEVKSVVQEVDIPVFTQHVDPHDPGSNTGAVVVEELKDSGISGSMINHAERRLLLSDIELIIKKLRKHGLLSLLCVDNVRTAAAGSALDPDMLGVEPPELIGTGISVSKARPEVILGSVKIVKEINSRVKVFCGAGISHEDDVARAIELGVEGVMFASAYIKAKDPEKLLSKMTEALVNSWTERSMFKR
ncbi:MAG: triose-phosphate isomerase [Nitrososphaerota archaeon]